MVLLVCSVLVVLSLSCRCVIVLCTLPSWHDIPFHFTLTLQTWHTWWSWWWCRPPYILPLLLCLPLTLCASSHIHLPLLCVCSFCDVISEDTDAPSWTNSGVSLLLLPLLPFSDWAFLLLLLFTLYAFLACPPHPTHLISVVFYFLLRLPRFSFVNCCVDDASSYSVISHFCFTLLLTDCKGLQFIEAWSWSWSCQCHFFVAEPDVTHCDTLLLNKW